LLRPSPNAVAAPERDDFHFASPPSAPSTDLSDREPETDEVLTGLPWWGARGTLYVALLLAVSALTWAALCRVDVVVSGRGTVIPEGRALPIRAETAGRIAYVLIHEGERVRAGQVIVQLDRTALLKRRAALEQERRALAAQIEQERSVDGSYTGAQEVTGYLARLERDAASLEDDLRRTEIIAPTAGIVTRMDPRAAGTTLSDGDTVAEIAPDNAPLVIEANVPNKDIGLVAAGQSVKIKLDAFPFYDYGTVPGRVVSVSPDAVRVDARTGGMYRVVVALDRSELGRQRPGDTSDIVLRPGLDATAEIVTERRSILSYLLSPARRLRGEAGSVGA